MLLTFEKSYNVFVTNLPESCVEQEVDDKVDSRICDDQRITEPGKVILEPSTSTV